MICAYEECLKEFEPKTHNQKYCCDECCRTATNLKLKQKYYEKKARLAGVKRICKAPGCSVILSMYNESNVCQDCENKKIKQKQKDILGLAARVTGKISKD